MSNDFIFDVDAVRPQTVVEVAELHQSDTHRIAAAKAAGLKAYRDSSWNDHGKTFFEDFVGKETSRYDAMHLGHVALLIHARPNGPELQLAALSDYYNAPAGTFEFKGASSCQPNFTIQELKTAIAARIAELNISETLLEESFVRHFDNIAEYQADRNLSFDQRMQTFRVPATA